MSALPPLTTLQQLAEVAVLLAGAWTLSDLVFTRRARRWASTPHERVIDADTRRVEADLAALTASWAGPLARR